MNAPSPVRPQNEFDFLSKLTNPEDDSRTARSKGKILRAAVDELVEHGIDVFRIESVAARAGVAKTTIYRHWKSRDDLLEFVFDNALVMPKSEISGDLYHDLFIIASGITAMLNTPPLDVLACQMMAANVRRHPIAMKFNQRYKDARLAVIEVIEGAQKRGEIRGDLHADDIHEMLFGPIFARRLFTDQAPSVEFAHTVVAQVLKVLKTGFPDENNA